MLLQLLAVLASSAPDMMHRQRLARQQLGERADGITQRWVGASSDVANVSQMGCTFRVPLDSEVSRPPERSSSECHYIY